MVILFFFFQESFLQMEASRRGKVKACRGGLLSLQAALIQTQLGVRVLLLFV